LTQAAPPGPRHAGREGIGRAVPSRQVLSLASRASREVPSKLVVFGCRALRGLPTKAGRPGRASPYTPGGAAAATSARRWSSPAFQGERYLTAKLTDNLADHRRNRGTAIDAGIAAELHGWTAADSPESAGPS
jgi:hypothetical protein